MGGENKENREIKERRRKRKSFAEERKRRLAGNLFTVDKVKYIYYNWSIDFPIEKGQLKQKNLSVNDLDNQYTQSSKFY